MKIHEYEANEIFQKFGIPVARGAVASNMDSIKALANDYGYPLILKAQVLTGGRGKAGGIIQVMNPDTLEEATKTIFRRIINGYRVKKIMVSQYITIKKEAYLSLLVDRNKRSVAFIGCSEGGMDIEEIAKKSPEKIVRQEIPASKLDTLHPDSLGYFTQKLFCNSNYARQTAHIMTNMGIMLKARDCSQIEINPLIVDDKDQILALDAKVILDDNALFRQKENQKLRGPATPFGLNFIPLDGDIGCMVNGAGLAMASMDIINLVGGKAANFLDVGGSSSPQKVISALKIILKDTKVRVILINIFGGITRCDDIARGILDAKSTLNIKVPLVIRLVGTNQNQGQALLEDAGLIFAKTLIEGAQKAISVIKAHQ